MLETYLLEVLPKYDQERVYISDIKKLTNANPTNCHSTIPAVIIAIQNDRQLWQLNGL